MKKLWIPDHIPITDERFKVLASIFLVLAVIYMLTTFEIMRVKNMAPASCQGSTYQAK